jgi:hypothetical protein
MGPAGLGTKNYCGGESQQQFSNQSGKRISSRNGVTPPVSDQNTQKVLERTKIWSRVPTGPETNKFHSTGEGQQQFNRLIDPSPLIYSYLLPLAASSGSRSSGEVAERMCERF